LFKLIELRNLGLETGNLSTGAKEFYCQAEENNIENMVTRTQDQVCRVLHTSKALRLALVTIELDISRTNNDEPCVPITSSCVLSTHGYFSNITSYLCTPKCMFQTNSLLQSNKLHKHIGARKGFVSPLWKIEMHNKNRRMKSFKYHNIPTK
jgi:hypothetical protein